MVTLTAGILLTFICYLGTVSTHADSVDCSECGVGLGDKTFLTLVRNGTPIRDTRAFPWLVSLRKKENFNSCGGAILNEYIILTAAHCVTDNKGKIEYDNKIHFQTESIKRMSKGADVEKIVIHPKYQLLLYETNGTEGSIAKYDIALIKLKKKIKCEVYKRPICLPTPNLKIPLGETNLIAGWGSPNPERRENMTEVLHYGTLKHVNFEKCIKNLPKAKLVRNHMLCLGGTKQTVCYGDSGSPLMHKINSKYAVVGVASSVTQVNCPISSPVMYTDVSKFVSWIKKEMKALLKTSLAQESYQMQRPTYLLRK